MRGFCDESHIPIQIVVFIYESKAFPNRQTRAGVKRLLPRHWSSRFAMPDPVEK